MSYFLQKVGGKGEITILNRDRRASGGHSLLRGDVKENELLGKPDINGVYKAKVEIYNPIKEEWQLKKAETTMFPRNWSEDKIKWEINGAWNSSSFGTEGRKWYGTSPSGVEIEGYINPRVTAYPVYEGGQ